MPGKRGKYQNEKSAGGTWLTFVDDGVDQAEGVHLEFDTLHGAVLDALILLIKVVVESRTIVSTITASTSATYPAPLRTGAAAYLSVHRLNVKF